MLSIASPTADPQVSLAVQFLSRRQRKTRPPYRSLYSDAMRLTRLELLRGRSGDLPAGAWLDP
jgi:hypothetical protein